MRVQTSTGMIRNYIDEPDSFEESCGTALLAYSALYVTSLPASAAQFR
jgi:rhamnogalacturonyl hydrolase YesR